MLLIGWAKYQLVKESHGAVPHGCINKEQRTCIYDSWFTAMIVFQDTDFYEMFSGCGSLYQELRWALTIQVSMHESCFPTTSCPQHDNKVEEDIER